MSLVRCKTWERWSDLWPFGLGFWWLQGNVAGPLVGWQLVWYFLVRLVGLRLYLGCHAFLRCLAKRISGGSFGAGACCGAGHWSHDLWQKADVFIYIVILKCTYCYTCKIYGGVFILFMLLMRISLDSRSDCLFTAGFQQLLAKKARTSIGRARTQRSRMQRRWTFRTFCYRGSSFV